MCQCNSEQGLAAKGDMSALKHMAQLAKSQHATQHNHAPGQSMHYLALMHCVGQPGSSGEPFALALFWVLHALPQLLHKLAAVEAVKVSSWPVALCQVKQEQAKLPHIRLGHDKVEAVVQEASGSLWGLQANCTPAEQLSHLMPCTTGKQLICLRTTASLDVQLLCGMPVTVHSLSPVYRRVVGLTCKSGRG